MKEVEVGWLGTMEVDIPQFEGEGERDRGVNDSGKTEYWEWKGREEFKRWEKKRVKIMEKELREKGELGEEDLVVGSITVSGWGEEEANGREENLGEKTKEE